VMVMACMRRNETGASSASSAALASSTSDKPKDQAMRSPGLLFG
jgi:hypothetical protein